MGDSGRQERACRHGISMKTTMVSFRMASLTNENPLAAAPPPQGHKIANIVNMLDSVAERGEGGTETLTTELFHDGEESAQRRAS